MWRRSRVEGGRAETYPNIKTINILNINKDIIPFEEEFPFEFIHLREGNQFSDVGEELINHTMKIITKKAPYDIYIKGIVGNIWSMGGR